MWLGSEKGEQVFPQIYTPARVNENNPSQVKVIALYTFINDTMIK